MFYIPLLCGNYCISYCRGTICGNRPAKREFHGYTCLPWSMILSLDNIEQGKENNFRKLSSYRVQSLGTPYDAVSIMHYSEYLFSVNGRKTIESKHGIPLGGPELSPTDVKQARLLYRCPTGEWSGIHCIQCIYIILMVIPIWYEPIATYKCAWIWLWLVLCL